MTKKKTHTFGGTLSLTNGARGRVLPFESKKAKAEKGSQWNVNEDAWIDAFWRAQAEQKRQRERSK
jgi:hypothetical protein